MGEYRHKTPTWVPPGRGGALPGAAAGIDRAAGAEISPVFPLSSHYLAKAFTITFMSFPRGIKRLRHE